jgi:hypothetical protein
MVLETRSITPANCQRKPELRDCHYSAGNTDKDSEHNYWRPIQYWTCTPTKYTLKFYTSNLIL